MNARIGILTNSLPSPSPIFKFPANSSPFHNSKLTPFCKPVSLHNFPLFRSFLLTRNPTFKVNGAIDTDNPVIVSGDEDGDLVIEPCLTRTLPPALTLEHGLQSLKDAVQELKLNPPLSSSGLIRYEVAVPPSAHAFDWFCCQPESSGIFPRFYISKQLESPAYESAIVSKTLGVFGIGIAVDFKQSSSSSDEWNSFQRYLLVDSPNITAYGFIDINYDVETSFMKRETGSFYFIIPQIELNEYEGFCMLAGTLAWGDSFLCTFERALHCYEVSLFQAGGHIPPVLESCHASIIKSTVEFNAVESEKLEMVYMEAAQLGGCDNAAASVGMKKSASSSSQFCLRFSPKSAVSINMWDHTGVTSSILQDCANINSVWASLIVEECSRLGLKYFCIAPGSRSSPLAIAASSHPHITCIACYDERSLAFHAIGYARGSQIPAVVITTSGTAVSNLFPAVVEASQDFVPLVLLTADRPSELHAAGANQAIDQVNHFGSYVRFFFNLPAPTDDITARMVLTTIDSAVYWATHPPYGPVHVNCPFREPLENSPRNWKTSCLEKLDFWLSSTQPFTRYIQMQPSYTTVGLTAELEKVIKDAKHGLLLIGAMHRENEIWAALILAGHLSWPIFADILSGIRLRKLLTSYPEYVENFIFIDHLDHVLLCDTVRQWAKPDVIIQLGSKITSKRISKMLEESFPCSYIMVDNHPCRHDPSHIVTHRIQSSISQFTGSLLKCTFPPMDKKWSSFLRTLDSTVAWELSFQISSEYSLTEPHVAHALSDLLDSETALFIGNSMPIRDADMYSRGVVNGIGTTSQLGLPCHWINVAGNRGASGIDGLLSTATGFAVGCKKRALCIIGDVSFLHDTNGLATLSSRTWRKPITVLVINNHGGSIFSFLPIAEKTDQPILEKYFYYNHNISISKLCAAHGVKHLLAKTKLELQEAFSTSQRTDADCVIEVASSIDNNATFHSILRKYASQAASHAFTILSQLPVQESVQKDFFQYKIVKLEYSLYGVKLTAPPTSISVTSTPSNFLRQGFILALTLDDGSTGFGEIAPLEIHKENLQDAEEQLRFLLHALKGATITYLLSLLRESFSFWIWRVIGIPPSSLFPSIRCGLEMAILNAIATRQNCSLLNLLCPQRNLGDVIYEKPSSIDICALVDSEGTPAEVAHIVSALVEEGFRAVKLKVGRRGGPREDAAIVKEIRRKVGTQIELRVDVNRKWTYDQAFDFGVLVKDCGLQYIEEPVKCEDDIVRFCEESGLPVALDETIDNIQGNIPDYLARFTHPGIVALVIKPCVIGGFENAAAIALWAHTKGKMAVISAAFESSLSLSSYVQFACYLDTKSAEISQALDRKLAKCVAHGLGTYKWLKQDTTLDPLIICRQPRNGHLGASTNDADCVLRNFQVNHNVISENSVEEPISTYQLVVDLEHFSYLIKVQETGESRDKNVLLFLHGFLGTSEDWIPIIKALSKSAKCIAVDLPGHGRSHVQSRENVAGDQRLSIEVVAAVLIQLIDKLAPGKVTLVGYSMGARIALYMALRFSGKIDGAIMISGSPGLKDVKERKIRAAKDESRAHSLLSFGLARFLDNWYQGHLWQSLREHPHFKKIIASRLQHDEIHGLAKALSDLSIGKQPSLWEDLKDCKIPLLFINGEKDVKFRKISQDINHKTSPSLNHEAVEVPNCGHAVHLENPLAVVRLIRQFLMKTRK